MTDIQVRPTIAGDLPRLMGMDHSISSDCVWQLELRKDGSQIIATFREVRLPRSIQLSYPYNPFSLGDDWMRKSVMFTAVADNAPVGYVVLIERSTSLVSITDLVVSPEARRRGAGGALARAAEEWSLKRGHRKLFLETQSRNYPAICFAQKHGYEFCGYNDHYYLSQDIALFFARALK